VSAGSVAAARPAIGVVPPNAHSQRSRLFTALGDALDVQFVPRRGGEERALDGVIVLDEHDRELPPRGLPSLAILDCPEPEGSAGPIQLQDGGRVDRRLRGHTLAERGAVAWVGLRPSRNDLVLATAADRPVWLAEPGEDTHYLASTAPEELAPHETLRDRLRDGRFLALLPILDFVRRLLGSRDWRPPPVRACFLFDDPNLHWSSYGHINFAELATDAREYDYHVSMATVPLDGWFFHPEAKRVFMHNPGALSLIVHGNEHVRRELARDRSSVDAMAVAGQALRRIEAFENRSGLTVDRVMAPPHGVCSETMAAALLRSGFEALTANSRYPWRTSPPLNCPLSGWWPGEFVAGGLTVLERRPFDTDLAELALAAYLNHPLILYGHHRDLASDPQRLRALRQRLAAVGPIQWQSLGHIARSNVSLRQIAHTLHVKMHSRMVDIEVPEGIDQMIVDAPGKLGVDADTLFCAGQRICSGEAVAVRPASRYRLRLGSSQEPPPPTPAARPLKSMWPIVRRVMTETRDRSVAVVDRLSSRAP
jgi:hypothetical protein